MRRIPLAAILFLAACHAPPPEGRYPCTTVADCPVDWFCRADRLCWSTADDAGVDASVPLDAATPDTTIDTGPSCSAETCNGADDDCDGLIDEGVITVGPAVVAASSGDTYDARIVGLPSGFAVLAGAMSSLGYGRVDASGAVTLAPSSLPASTAGTVTHAWSTASDGSRVLITGTDSAYTSASLFVVDSATGASALPPLAVPDRSGLTALTTLVSDARGGHATVFVLHADLGGTTPSVIRRLRVDLTGAAVSVSAATTAASDVGGVVLAALSTDDTDYFVYVNTSFDLVLAAGPAGDGTSGFHTVGAIAHVDETSDALRDDGLVLALRDVHGTVSASNPLGVAWALKDASELHFVEITNTTVLSAGSPVTVAGTNGPIRSFVPGHPLALVALPAAMTPSSGHWALITGDHDPAMSVSQQVQVREIVGNGDTVRLITVPGEAFAHRADIDVAQSSGVTRLVETGNGGGIVTRSIGCE
jgi:hypothetical protein